MQQITIRAKMIEAVDSEGVGYPEAVVIEGAHMLMASALRDIAQDVIDGYYGNDNHGYLVFFHTGNLRDVEDRDSVTLSDIRYSDRYKN